MLKPFSFVRYLAISDVERVVPDKCLPSLVNIWISLAAVTVGLLITPLIVVPVDSVAELKVRLLLAIVKDESPPDANNPMI